MHEADFLLELAQIQAESLGWSRRLMNACASADADRNDIIVALGARFNSKRWFKELDCNGSRRVYCSGNRALRRFFKVRRIAVKITSTANRSFDFRFAICDSKSFAKNLENALEKMWSADENA